MANHRSLQSPVIALILALTTLVSVFAEFYSPHVGKSYPSNV